MTLQTFWQLDVYWEDDGPEYDETGRDTLYTFKYKPDLDQLRVVLESYPIYSTDDKIKALLDGSGILMNDKGDCCQLTEITKGELSMSKVYRVVSSTEDGQLMQNHLVASSEQEARDLWESDYKEGEYTHIVSVELTTEVVRDYV